MTKELILFIDQKMPFELEKKREKKEERLYEPIRIALEKRLQEYLNCQKESIGVRFVGKTHLEITASGKELSEELKEVLDTDVLSILRVEKFSPDIMGFMQRADYSPKELITVEIKDEKISIQSISRAKLYKDFFRARYGMLISSKGMGEEIKRFMSNRYEIRGDVIIAKYDEASSDFKFDNKFYSNIPEPFKTTK